MKGLIVLILLLTVLASGRVIVVPDSAATIQAGLNMAHAGDTVLVMPDEYEENITWPSTDGIKLCSATVPDSTTIAGGGNGRVISVGSGISRATVITGFTITGGKASSAAGLYLQGSPSIIGNRVVRNECHGERNYGGGIYCSSNTSPLIMGNEIAGNVCSDTNTWNYGGGIYISRDCTAEILLNLIAGNECAEGYWNYGAGIYVGSGGEPVVYQNVIRDNENKHGQRGHGAGIHSEGRSLVFCNLIAGNTNRSDLWNYGAGIKVSGPTTVNNNTITLNTCSGGNWAHGGGIYVGINDTGYVRNNIIVQNSASSGGGIYRYDNSGSVLFNSYNDVWSNAGGNYVNCSPGTGSISQDPLFVSGSVNDFYLAQVAAGQPTTSPCVDAGDTLLMTNPLNLDSLLHVWTTRTDSVYDMDAIDMGYHCPVAIPLGVAEERVPGFQGSRGPGDGARPAPNPFTEQVRFQFGRAAAGPVRLVIRDAAGRVVYEVGADRAVGLRWDGRDRQGNRVTAGVYFYRLAGDDWSASGRVLRLR
jgi:hypothetical protein